MIVQRQRAVVPLEGGEVCGGSPVTRQGGLSAAINLDLRHGVWRQRQSYTSRARTVTNVDDYEQNDAAPRDVMLDRAGLPVMVAGGRLFQGEVPADLLDAPHVPDLHWQTATIDQAADMVTKSLTSVDYLASDGAAMRAVAQASTTAVVVTVYREGARVGSVTVGGSSGATPYQARGTARLAYTAGRLAVLSYSGTFDLKLKLIDAETLADVAMVTVYGHTVRMQDADVCTDGTGGFLVAFATDTSGSSGTGTEILYRRVSSSGTLGVTETVASLLNSWVDHLRVADVGGTVVVAAAHHKNLDTDNAITLYARNYGVATAVRSVATATAPTSGTSVWQDLDMAVLSGTTPRVVVAWGEAEITTSIAADARAVYQVYSVDTATPATALIDGRSAYGVGYRVALAVCEQYPCGLLLTDGHPAEEHGSGTPATNNGQITALVIRRGPDSSGVPARLGGVGLAAQTAMLGRCAMAQGWTVPVLTADRRVDDLQRDMGGEYQAVRQAFTRIDGVTPYPRTRLQMAPLGRGALVPGGVPVIADGSGRGMPAAFAWRPKITMSRVAGTSSRGYVGTAWYRCCYMLTDADGRAYYSEPSDPVSLTTVGGDVVTMYVTPYTLGAGASDRVRLVPFMSIDDGETYQRCDPVDGSAIGWGNANSEDTVAVQIFGATSSADMVRGVVQLYTDGGVLPSVCPESSYQAVYWGRRYWLVTGGPRAWFSREVIPGEGPAWSEALTLTLAGEDITGVQPLGDRLVVFTDRATYMLAGDGPNDQGYGGFTSPQFVLGVGLAARRPERCCSSTSGVWWIGTDGELRQIDMGAAVTAHPMARPDYGYTGTIARPDGGELTSVVACDRLRQVRVTVSGQSYLRVYDYQSKAWSRYTFASFGAAFGSYDAGVAYVRNMTGWGDYVVDLRTQDTGATYVDTVPDPDTLDTYESAAVTVTLETAPMHLAGPLGVARLWRSTWTLTATTTCTVTLGESIGSAGYTAGDAASRTKSYTPTTTNDKRQPYWATTVGLQSLTLQHAYQRGAWHACAVSAVADTSSTTPVEVHALMLEYGQESGSGRYAESLGG